MISLVLFGLWKWNVTAGCLFEMNDLSLLSESNDYSHHVRYNDDYEIKLIELGE